MSSLLGKPVLVSDRGKHYHRNIDCPMVAGMLQMPNLPPDGGYHLIILTKEALERWERPCGCVIGPTEERRTHHFIASEGEV